MDKVFALDIECTVRNKGDPFDQNNHLVLGAYGSDTTYNRFYTGDVAGLQNALDTCSLVILFNAKFDLHWIKRIGCRFSHRLPIWDCQLAEFILSNQRWKYPSLDDSCAKQGLPRKLDLVRKEFWERTCSCHVSIAERIQRTLETSYVSRVTANITTRHDLLELKKSASGERLIQSSMKLLDSADLRNYELILKQRLEHIELTTKENTNYQTLNMILVWLRQAAEYVERWKNHYALITTIQQGELEICCVEHVMHLSAMLREQNGWKQHSPMCKNTKLDTDAIPFEILDDYLRGDITSTYLLYLNQVERFKQPEHQKKLALFRMQCYDLLVLEEMEYKGYTFNVPAALEEAAVLDSQSKQLATKILSLFPNVPINLSSPDHISCILYGGTIVDVVKVPIGVFKTGNKIGEIRYKNLEQPYVLPRLIEPLKGSALKKEGYFATNEDVLMNLKAKGVAKKIIETLLEIRGLEKLRGTYYDGIPKLIEEHTWENNVVHGNLNQCVVTTSRLSATKPNQQNMPKGCKALCVSRYND